MRKSGLLAVKTVAFLLGMAYRPRITGQKVRPVLPPANRKADMADQELQYRVRRKGSGWYWEVLSNSELLQSGIEPTSVAARVAAFEYILCLDEHEPIDSIRN